MLDHLIVSGNLLDTSSKFFTGEDKATVARLPYLLTEDKKYGDDEPFRTYKWMKYQGGIIDHLPVYADFELILYKPKYKEDINPLSTTPPDIAGKKKKSFLC